MQSNFDFWYEHETSLMSYQNREMACPAQSPFPLSTSFIFPLSLTNDTDSSVSSIRVLLTAYENYMKLPASFSHLNAVWEHQLKWHQLQLGGFITLSFSNFMLTPVTWFCWLLMHKFLITYEHSRHECSFSLLKNDIQLHWLFLVRFLHLCWCQWSDSDNF
jgi:hypothetical protein